MDDSTYMFFSVATIALCTIVGIYYFWVRKLEPQGAELQGRVAQWQ